MVSTTVTLNTSNFVEFLNENEIKEIERRMQPGCSSQVVFLEQGQSLKDLVEK